MTVTITKGTAPWPRVRRRKAGRRDSSRSDHQPSCVRSSATTWSWSRGTVAAVVTWTSGLPSRLTR